MFDDYHPHMEKLRAQEPPQHFHYLQVEYIQMVEGELYVDVGDKRILLTPSDGELGIPA
jgi:quercetin dioxygenase-like cupin family protein